MFNLSPAWKVQNFKCDYFEFEDGISSQSKARLNRIYWISIAALLAMVTVNVLYQTGYIPYTSWNRRIILLANLATTLLITVCNRAHESMKKAPSSCIIANIYLRATTPMSTPLGSPIITRRG